MYIYITELSLGRFCLCQGLFLEETCSLQLYARYYQIALTTWAPQMSFVGGLHKIGQFDRQIPPLEF